MAAEPKTLKVTLIKGINKKLKSHQKCVRGLGLRRIGQTVEVVNTPENRGMITKVRYLLEVKE
jgi:large subunit ribosomal protein L30